MDACLAHNQDLCRFESGLRYSEGTMEERTSPGLALDEAESRVERSEARVRYLTRQLVQERLRLAYNRREVARWADPDAR